MDDGSQHFYVQRLKVVLLVSSLVSLFMLILAAGKENFAGEWRSHQREYRERLISTAETEPARTAAERMDISFRQLFLPKLDRIDRCVTCHVAIDDPSQSESQQPLRTHSGDILKNHPSSKFGCTVCHEGQGRAVERADAHGEVKHWPTPLLRGEAVYGSCGRCHYENDLYQGSRDLFASSNGKSVISLDQSELDVAVPGVESASERAIGRGKQIVLSSGCLGCHVYRGRGGALGPDITHVGDKTSHDFDFHHVDGEHTVTQWMFEHFKNPAEVVPGTLMPELGLNDGQASDLAHYMVSLRRKNMAAEFTPLPPRQFGKERPVSGKQLFAMYCNACHGKQGQGGTVLDPELMMLAEPPHELITPALNNVDTLAVASDDYLRYIIRNGRHGTNMIGWTSERGGLANDEIDRLVTFIRSWSGQGADLQRIGAERGNARYGRVMYRMRCLSCHGSEGKGGIGPSLASPSFLAIASDDFLARAIVHGRANTAMPAWKHLSENVINDLLAYLRTWEHKPADKNVVLKRLATAEPPSARALRIGQTLYRSNCANCHGLNGQGDIGPSLNSNELLSIAGDDYLFDAIVHGRPGTAMPSWKHLSAEDLVDLINYVRSWNDRERKTLEPWIARGDWERGGRLYISACASCHGRSGEGLSGSQLNNEVFLSSASDAMLREWVSHGKTGTEMRAFLKGKQGMVEFSEAQIEDVITYIRRFEHERPLVTSRPGIGIPNAGERIYESACAQCHGDNGEGRTGSALANPDFLRSTSDGYLLATIAMGRDGTEMRPMGRGAQSNVEMSGEDIRNVVAFIRSWEFYPAERSVANVPTRYVIGADLIQGRKLYAGFCAGCHGKEGNEGWAPSLNNRDFLMAATDGFLQATIAQGRSDTPMRPFGQGAQGVAELTSDQINNIVAYIRLWAPDGFKPIHGPTPSRGQAVNAANPHSTSRTSNRKECHHGT